MGNKSRVLIALDSIRAKLIKLNSHVYYEKDLYRIFQSGKKKWKLPAAMNHQKFIKALEHEGLISLCRLDFGTELYEGYYLNNSPDYYVVSQLLTKSYVSHATALNIWGMMGAQDTIYVNREQSPTHSKSIKGKLLAQSAIDAAFKVQQRQSSLVSSFDNKKVALLKGKFSDHLGVIDFDLKGKEHTRITDLERTLIDCVVRPAYSVKPKAMIEVFEKAKRLISTFKLVDYLDKLDYIYPYHQSIGYYLEKAGNYSESEINLFHSKGAEHDFYLTYGMTSPAYSKKWRLYFPAE